MKTLAIQFSRLGPYHIARIDSASNMLKQAGWNVVAVETARTDHTYAWNEETDIQAWERHTVFSDEKWEKMSAGTIKQAMSNCLNQLKPDAIAISGWGSRDARACLSWCKVNQAIAIAMSETREGDGRRVWWKEQIKKRLIRQFNSGLVGAKSHHDYMVTLGMPSTRIEFGYNVVHNQYFTQQAEHFRHEDGIREIRPYFLASNRFVERKNLSRLVKAFADCFGRVGAAGPIRDLCLLGDGPLMNELLDQCDTLGLKVEKCAPWESHSKDGDTPIIFFPGFRQIDELPRFYAHAGCFVHPAISEPWGLVINEAMAAGLPVLSSRNVGAAEELIEEGKNGWKFNPNDTASISDCLYRYWLMDEPSTSNFGAQSRLLVEQRCPTSAFGSGLSKILR